MTLGPKRRRPTPISDIPKSGPQGHDLPLGAFGVDFFQTLVKTSFAQNKILYLSFIHMPLVTREALMTQWAPAVIMGPTVSWAPGQPGDPGPGSWGPGHGSHGMGPLVARGLTACGLWALSRACGPLLGEILSMCLTVLPACSYFK